VSSQRGKETRQVNFSGNDLAADESATTRGPSEVSSSMKPYINRHIVLPVFFNESSADIEGWCEGAPGVGRVIGVKSVLYSDGSSRRFYKMKPETKITPISKAEAQKLIKRAQRKIKMKETRS
jgi:hypothetical protein